MRFWRYSFAKTSILSMLLALLAGASLPFAFAPYQLYPLAIFSPALLLWLWQKSSPKSAFILGICYGMGLFGIGTSWVFVSIHRYGNTDVPLAIFITFLFVLILSGFIACQGYVFKRYFKGSWLAFCLLGFPSSWVFFEWIRTWLFSGFPWLFLGYSQIDAPLGGFAPIASVYGVSFLVALCSGLLLILLQGKRTQKLLSCLILVMLFGSGEWLRNYAWTKPIGHEYSVSLVQGNIAPSDKFMQTDPILAAKKIYVGLSDPVWGRDIIIWPENAIAYPLPFAEPFIAELNHLAKTRHSALIAGIQTVVNKQKQDYYNTIIATGLGSGIYHKRYLVPFGEYLPLEWLRGLINFFDIPMSSFISGPEIQPLLKAKDLTLAPLTCYEVAFPSLVRNTLQDAQAIVTISEDGWFGDSLGPHQHLQIARMRALETGRYVLRAATSGISAIIDSRGKLQETSPQFVEMVLNGKVQGMQGKTPWLHLGIYPLLGLLLLAFIAPGFFRRSFPLFSKKKIKWE